MALLFCDSFDHYATGQIYEKYDGGGGATIGTNGRNTAYSPNGALNCYFGSVSRSLPNSNTLIFGIALNPAGGLAGKGSFIQLFDGSTLQASVSISSTNQVQISGANGVIASTPNSMIPLGVYTYIEVAITFSTTATGSVAININGVSQANVTGVITSFSGDNYANSLSLYGGPDGTTAIFDDFYICDGTGTVNNTFLGDVRVAMSLPSGNGRINSWTRVGGSSSGNYTAVDDNPPDGDTSYVYSSTVAAIDAYQFTSIGTPAALIGVQLVASVRKDDSGSRVVALGFGNSTTDVFNAGSSVPNEYTMIRSALNTNPITGNAWAPTDLASAQIAVKVIS